MGTSLSKAAVEVKQNLDHHIGEQDKEWHGEKPFIIFNKPFEFFDHH